MPRKQELPAVKVLDYFGTAPYEAAVLVLQLAGQAVKMRAPKPAAEKTKKPSAQAAVDAATRSSTGPAATTSSQGAGTGAVASPPGPRPRRRTPTATPATSGGPVTEAPTAMAATTGAPAGQTDGLPGMSQV